MASKAVAAAPEAISEESAKIQLADRPTETQAVAETTHADGTTTRNAPSVAGEQEQDSEHISSASADKNIGSQPLPAAPAPSTPKPETAEQSEASESNACGSLFLMPDTAVSGTLSAPDKVKDAVVPSWTKYSDLTIQQKFEQARLMDFDARDAYLRERCRDFKMVMDHAASVLSLAAAIIESNLPFFLIHFRDMDAQGERSDLKGKKVMGKTEWLRQNLPDISRGTFYAAYNSVKKRYAEQTRLMLGGEVPTVSNREGRLTDVQNAVVQALLGEGFKKKDAVAMAKAAEGNDFESLFKSALTYREGGVGTGTAAGVTETGTLGVSEGQELGRAQVVGSGAESAPEDDSEDDEESDQPDGGLERKHYWLTPAELKAQLKAEFGEMFDPCPHPRPEGFDGLDVDWGPVNFVNPLFHQVVENGRTIGISMWIKKALEEQAKGKTSVLVYPQYSWFHLLLNAGAEMRSLGQVKWLATEDGSPQKAALPIVMFVLRGKKPRDL